ncbi:unnamed protein product, partial [Merluccius merluccius]
MATTAQYIPRNNSLPSNPLMHPDSDRMHQGTTYREVQKMMHHEYLQGLAATNTGHPMSLTHHQWLPASNGDWTTGTAHIAHQQDHKQAVRGDDLGSVGVNFHHRSHLLHQQTQHNNNGGGGGGGGGGHHGSWAPAAAVAAAAAHHLSPLTPTAVSGGGHQSLVYSQPGYTNLNAMLSPQPGAHHHGMRGTRAARRRGQPARRAARVPAAGLRPPRRRGPLGRGRAQLGRPGAVRQAVQAAQDQAGLHAGGRGPGTGHAVRQRVLPDHHMPVRGPAAELQEHVQAETAAEQVAGGDGLEHGQPHQPGQDRGAGAQTEEADLDRSRGEGSAGEPLLEMPQAVRARDHVAGRHAAAGEGGGEGLVLQQATEGEEDDPGGGPAPEHGGRLFPSGDPPAPPHTAESCAM